MDQSNVTDNKGEAKLTKTQIEGDVHNSTIFTAGGDIIIANEKVSPNMSLK